MHYKHMGIYLPFEKEKNANIAKQAKDTKLQNLAVKFVVDSAKYNYAYNFTWLGRPIIQYPQDILVFQELIWKVKPKFIIETGIAHGGSIIFSASILQLIGKHGKVIGIDIDIRKHNRIEIEKHPLSKNIIMLEGSSTDVNIVQQVKKIIKSSQPVLVMLDSNHTETHVLDELNLYSEFVTKSSYIIVLDTMVEKMPKGQFKNRPWDVGNNPKTAVNKFLSVNHKFIPDINIDNKLLISSAPGGYLKKIK
jgi:cephalosporin hydroxylase